MAELKRAGIGCPYCGNDLYVDFDVCPHCGQEVPKELLKLIQEMSDTSSKQDNSKDINTTSLTHFEDLEEDSKTKIGTFERLITEKYAKPIHRGFDDADYAPLVNLLASVLELELSYAIFDKFLPYWLKLQTSYEINIPRDREKCTLGSIGYFLRIAEKDKGHLLPDSEKENWNFAEKKFGKYCAELKKHLDVLTDGRNKAAHKSAISKQDFQTFFAEFQPFYEQYMPAILQLKKCGDSKGYRLFVEMRKNFPEF